MADTTKLASVGFVEGTIKRDTNGSVRINNSAGSPVTLSQNPQTSGSTMQTTSNKEVPTIGWTDANRTSKVKTGTGANAQLVDMWIE